MGTDLLESGEGNKYLVVEKHLKQAINGGVYQADDRLPSIRSLSQELNVSKNTVIRAYQSWKRKTWCTRFPNRVIE